MTKYNIILQSLHNWQFPWAKDEKVIDVAYDLGHARYIVRQYQFIYGSNWKVRYERA